MSNRHNKYPFCLTAWANVPVKICYDSHKHVEARNIFGEMLVCEICKPVTACICLCDTLECGYKAADYVTYFPSSSVTLDRPML